MAENSGVPLVPVRRWSDRVYQVESNGGGLREAVGVLRRQKWIILSTFLVTAMGLGAALALRVSHGATCDAAVKKPSQMFMPVGQAGTLSNASVPLLEGQTYKDIVEGLAFATKVANFAPDLHLSPTEVNQRLWAQFRDPDLLRLKASGPDPSTAIRIANAACQTLVEMNQKELRVELEAQVESITRLLGEASKDVEQTQVAVAAYMKREGLVNVDYNSGSSDLFRALQVLAEQELARSRDKALLEAAEERAKALKVEKGAPASALPFPVEDPAVTTFRAQVEAVRMKLSDARKQFTDAHPMVKDLRAQLADLQRELDGHLQEPRVRREFRPSAEHELAIRQSIVETNQEIMTRKAQVGTWSRLIQEQRRALGVIPGQRAEIERLKLSLAFGEDRYRALSRKLDETRINLEATKGNISIVQPAVHPDPPNTFRRVLIAAVLLLTLPLGVGVLVDYLDTSIRSPVAFGRQVGLACLATVPKARRFRSVRALRAAPSGQHLEAFRILRSGLRFASGDIPPRRIAIVGPKRGEGRSTLVLHLARALAEDQKRVVIVDADLRSSSSLTRMLRINNNNRGGLVEVLMGERSLDEVLCGKTPCNALLLPAKAEGRVLPPNTELLFRTPQFEQLVGELSQRGDVVLFDTPPILEFADTLELLPYVDGVIFVAEAGKATEENVRRSLDLVRSSGARSLGFVLNKVRTEQNGQRILDLVRSSGVRSLGVVLNKVRNGR